MDIKDINKPRIIMSVVSAMFIMFIFINSIRTGTDSVDQSGNVVSFLQSLADAAGIKVTISHLVIRKTAHFVEFAVLGTLLGITLKTYTKRVLKNIFVPLFIGLFTAVTDEFIQLYVDGRAGMVQDVVLDFTGMITGLGLAILVILLRQRRKLREHLCEKSPETVDF
ncbi:MAG: VanZ family protein [Clostridiales bacterium]|jgi:VanZ family protein|nr:VanZ family protein [Clostridiales bacterium]